MTDKEEEIHVDKDSARAGATPHVTRYVLSISLVVIVVIFAIIVWSGS